MKNDSIVQNNSNNADSTTCTSKILSTETKTTNSNYADHSEKSDDLQSEILNSQIDICKLENYKKLQNQNFANVYIVNNSIHDDAVDVNIDKQIIDNRTFSRLKTEFEFSQHENKYFATFCNMQNFEWFNLFLSNQSEACNNFIMQNHSLKITKLNIYNFMQNMIYPHVIFSVNRNLVQCFSQFLTRCSIPQFQKILFSSTPNNQYLVDNNNVPSNANVEVQAAFNRPVWREQSSSSKLSIFQQPIIDSKIEFSIKHLPINKHSSKHSTNNINKTFIQTYKVCKPIIHIHTSNKKYFIPTIDIEKSLINKPIYSLNGDLLK